MKETEVQTIYDSPRVKVVEIKARQVICQSNEQGSLNPMESTDGAW